MLPFFRRDHEGNPMNNRTSEQVLQMLLAIEAVKEAVEKFEQGEVNLIDTLNAITRAVSRSRARFVAAASGPADFVGSALVPVVSGFLCAVSWFDYFGIFCGSFLYQSGCSLPPSFATSASKNFRIARKMSSTDPFAGMFTRTMSDLVFFFAIFNVNPFCSRYVTNRWIVRSNGFVPVIVYFFFLRKKTVPGTESRQDR